MLSCSDTLLCVTLLSSLEKSGWSERPGGRQEEVALRGVEEAQGAACRGEGRRAGTMKTITPCVIEPFLPQLLTDVSLTYSQGATQPLGRVCRGNTFWARVYVKIVSWQRKG